MNETPTEPAPEPDEPTPDDDDNGDAGDEAVAGIEHAVDIADETGKLGDNAV